MIESFSLNRPDYTMAGEAFFPLTDKPGPLVVICHGLFSSMASEKLTALAKTITETFHAPTVRFDCLGCGKSGGDVAQTTLTGRATEISAAADYWLTDIRVDDRLILIGSSFGGSASFYAAGGRNDVLGVAGWSSPGDFADLAAAWSAEGGYGMTQAFYDDLARVDLPARLKKIRSSLVIHGREDETVPLAHAYWYQTNLRAPCRLAVIDGADHRLSGDRARAVAFRETIDWLSSLGLSRVA